MEAVEPYETEADMLRQELAEILYIISHDFNAPVRHVKLFANAIKEQTSEVIDEDSEQLLDKLIISNERLAKMLKGVLALSRINTNSLEANEVDLFKIVDEVISNKEKKYSQKTNIEYNVGKLSKIRCDVAQIKIVINELLKNAMVFRKNDEPCAISVTQQVTDGNLIVSVCDNGIGIDKHFHKDIFKPLRRAVPKSDYPGLGIGLALVSKIMQRHNGNVDIESEVGCGTKLKLIFPISCMV